MGKEGRGQGCDPRCPLLPGELRAEPTMGSHPMAAAAESLAAPTRHAVTLSDGRLAYAWAQSLAEVELWVPAPPGARAAHFDVQLTPTHIRLGLVGNPPYLDVRAGGGWDECGPGRAGVRAQPNQTHANPHPPSVRLGRPHQGVRELLDSW